MDMQTLLKTFANPEMIHNMDSGDKLTGVLVTVALGMGITFAVLILLQVLMAIMAAILVKKPKAPEAAVTSAPAGNAAPAKGGDDKELIAVISAAVAAALGTSIGNIVVKNVRKSIDSSPAWHKAAVSDQMNTRF